MTSEDPESGRVGSSTVCVQLEPFDEVAEGRRIRVTAGHAPVGRRLLRVLVVDDNRDATDSLAMLVALWGHEVHRAYGGESALELATAYRPDVVLLDIAMPKINGCQVVWQLRQQAHTKDAQLIAITGYADEVHRRLCRYAGFDDCLFKPVPASVVEELLSRQRDRLAESPGAARSARWEYGLPVIEDDDAKRRKPRLDCEVGGMVTDLA